MDEKQDVKVSEVSEVETVSTALAIIAAQSVNEHRKAGDFFEFSITQADNDIPTSVSVTVVTDRRTNYAMTSVAHEQRLMLHKKKVVDLNTEEPADSTETSYEAALRERDAFLQALDNVNRFIANTPEGLAAEDADKEDVYKEEADNSAAEEAAKEEAAKEETAKEAAAKEEAEKAAKEEAAKEAAAKEEAEKAAKEEAAKKKQATAKRATAKKTTKKTTPKKKS